VIDRKTAALIAWCCAVGGLVDEALVQPLHRFGTELGYAFQIADDVLDLRLPCEGRTFGDSGKDAGQDLREGKMTLPLILACNRDAKLLARVRTILAAGPPMHVGEANAIIEAALATSAVDEAVALAKRHARAATAALRELPPSCARDALADVAYFVAERNT
jgi:octaprenyl-diphosphate synthase